MVVLDIAWQVAAVDTDEDVGFAATAARVQSPIFPIRPSPIRRTSS